MALSTAERVVITARLAEAQKAYHSLQIGTSARVVVDQNGERVEFTATNSTKLKAYIQELQDLLACKSTKSGPIKTWLK